MANPHSISRNLPLLFRSSPRLRYRSCTVLPLGRTASSTNAQRMEDSVESRFPLYTPEPPPPSISLEYISHLPLRKKLAALSTENVRLEEVVKRVKKVEETEELTKNLAEYTEQDLEEFYALLLATSSPNGNKRGQPIAAPAEDIRRLSAPRTMGRDTREDVIEALLKRLNSKPRSSTTLGDETRTDNPDESSTSITTQASASPLALMDIPARHQTIRTLLSLTNTLAEQGSDLGSSNVPVVGISKTEWTALIEDFAANGEGKMAIGILDVMRNLGVVPSDDLVEYLLSSLSSNHDFASLDSYISRFTTTSPETLLPSTYLISAHLKLGQPHQSLPILHSLESNHLYPPQHIYTSIIHSLLTSHKPLLQSSKALAWDLFVHSRLVAYPTPSEEMYALIIRSCADPRDPQPERALDLWMEMKSEGLQPTAKTYESIILACARVKKYYFEAFRLFREMVGIHQSITSSGISTVGTGYEPTLRMLNALLEGTKRNGDLTRARWILAEVIKLSRLGVFKVDERMVVGVFQTYAAFKPVLGRGDVKVRTKEGKERVRDETRMEEDAVDKPANDLFEAQREPDSEPILGQLDPNTKLEEDHVDNLLSISSPSFSPVVGPQTASEVIQEVNRLFDVILHETSYPNEEGSSTFSHLRIRPNIINAFLSVHLIHSPLKNALEIWSETWERTGVEPNGRSYLLLVQRFAYPKNVTERQLVAERLPGIWEEYEKWTERQDVRDEAFEIGLGPREVEKVWSLAVRAYALLDNLTESLRILDLFTRRFPSSDITTLSPLPIRSTILSTSPLRTLEDNVPPHILFPDIEMLHHRLVREGDAQGLAFVKWVCKLYEAALGKRRKLRMREMGKVGKPPVIGRRKVEGLVKARV